MLADSIAIWERLADPRLFVIFLPLFVIFGTAACVAVYSLAQSLKASGPVKPVRVTTDDEATTPIAPAPPPAAITESAYPNSELTLSLEAKVAQAQAGRADAERDRVVLLEKLATATTALQKEQELRSELQLKADKLGTQFEEVLHEVEQIYQLNVGVTAFEELTRRIDQIREGRPLKPRTPEATQNSTNPETLLIAEQAGEIKKLRDIVGFYREKYGE